MLLRWELLHDFVLETARVRAGATPPELDRSMCLHHVVNGLPFLGVAGALDPPLAFHPDDWAQALLHGNVIHFPFMLKWLYKYLRELGASRRSRAATPSSTTNC